MPRPILSLLLVAFSIWLPLAAHGQVVINELMYHPISETTNEEWVELYNPGVTSVVLTGWQFSSGVQYTFPAGSSIAAGGYLVVAANPTVFHAKYPGVANYVAGSGWQTVVAGLVPPNSGQLSNSSNHVKLQNAAGLKIDEVTYSDDGDWAIRQKDVVLDYLHRGWDWTSAADGGGKSLELINALFTNDYGQNWTASTTAGGTPGLANSVAAIDIAPIIVGAEHFPLVPKSTTSGTPEAVFVTATVLNDEASAPVVTLRWKLDAASTFGTLAMADDGAHGDGAPGDGVFGATVPAQANAAIVEYYIEATDGGAHRRFWPAPALSETGALLVDGTGQPTTSPHALFQVDDTAYAGAEPLYRMVMKAADKTELANINLNSPAGSGPSHAKMNATWISSDGTGTELRYLTGVRNRGHGSATKQPQGFNVSFLNDHTWKAVISLNLNTQYTFSQYFGSALFRAAGLPGPESRPVQARVNGSTLTPAGSPSFGFYVANEVQNSDFAAHHFPLDSSGNLYRAQRTDVNPPANQMAAAYLQYQAPGVGQLAPDPYRAVWFKHTNSSEDQWTDLIGLTQALDKAVSDSSFNITYRSGETATTYHDAVQARMDVEECMRYFAIETIVDNSETNLSAGYGDDYYVYFGDTDPRARLIPYDLDTICGQGDAVPTPTQHGLFRMINKDDSSANGPTPMNAFIKHPLFAPIYYKHLKELLDGPFTKANFESMLDNTLTGVVPQAQIDSIKTFESKALTTPSDPTSGGRIFYIASLVPLNISVTNSQTVAGTALPTQSGYLVSVAPRTTTSPASVTNADPSHCKLIGKANAITTRSVKVNGVAVTWSAWQATWTAASVTLIPGINKIVIQAFDAGGVETERFNHEIWYDDATTTSVSGTISVNTTWFAASGPYVVTASVSISSGATLTIEPGTSVYLASAVNLTVASGGRLLAEGTDSQRIRFSRAPGTATNWGSVTILGAAGSPETRIAYADFEFNVTATGTPCIEVNAGTAYLDHLTFANTGSPYIHVDSASFIISNCVFPKPTASFEPLHGTGGVKAGGRGILRDSYVGQPNGFNDSFDFTGGNRPSPILQVIGNVFDGSGDDNLDLDSTDAWIEGNVFMHVHRDPSRTDDARDTGSAISGGTDFAGVYNEWTILNNIFYDVDHVFMTKQGGRVAFINNTVSHVAKESGGGLLTDIAFINWTDNGLALPAASLGSGAFVANNILHDCAVLQANYNSANHTVIMSNNLFPVGLAQTPWTGAGTPNQYVDPRLNLSVLAGTPVASVTAAQLRQAFQPLTGSPAIGASFGGRNIGGLGAHGIAISGEPAGTTTATSATLSVGLGGTINWGTVPAFQWGWTAFRWRLDGGPWQPSATTETAVGNPPPFTTPATISLPVLSTGPHTVEVIGKNDANFFQDDTVVYPAAATPPVTGTPALISRSKTWTVDPTYVAPPTPTVRINEVLAKNTEVLPVNSPVTYPDVFELYNSGTASIDLSGMGLTDNATIPYKYTIPGPQSVPAQPATTLAAGAYLVLYGDLGNAPGLHTGFSLKQSGDTLTLTKSAAAGGGVIDAVAFGAQLPDQSIGRRTTDGAWDLCVPTFGFPNVVAAQGTTAGVKINEWLADEQTLFGDDFVELYNLGTLPVNIGNCYLTDNPAEYITRHQIRQLTFLAGNGYTSFLADGNTSSGPEHLSFKLSPAQGEIGLFTSAQGLIDNIVYGSQSTDVSQGRTPNGSATLAFFTAPTPGAPNPGNVGGSGGTSTVNAVAFSKVWSYEKSGTDLSATFYPVAFNDSAWVTGGSLLYVETTPLTQPFVTSLAPPVAGSLRNAYYFRTHFNYAGGVASPVLNATLMCDDGCVIYLNGVEVGRYNMPTGTVAYATAATTNIADATEITQTLAPSSALVIGDNVLAVEVHQQNATSSDIVWGMKLDITGTLASGASPIVVNEVLALNSTGSGWIELYNPSTSPYTLTDMSLTNDVSDPRRFVFPTATIPASGYYRIDCNALAAVSATNTGFALDGTGDEVYLFKKVADGSGLQDSVVFGLQVPDFSVGRYANATGPFVLCLPTAAAANDLAHVAATSTISSVKINEWMANPYSFAAPGWFELYNTSASPVTLGGNYLTDNLNSKTKYAIPPLTFLGAGANRWRQIFADSPATPAGGHVSFVLNPSGESLGVFSSNQVQIEAVNFGAQTYGVSSGRYTDGTTTIIAMPGVATPGAANQTPPADTDGDGMSDAWEMANFGNLNQLPGGDFDGDGMTNLQEFLAGTDPKVGSSILRPNVTVGVPGQMLVNFTAQPNKAYTVRYKNSLNDAAWTKLTDIAPAPALRAPLTVPDNTVGTQAQRFYEVLTPPVP